MRRRGIAALALGLGLAGPAVDIASAIPIGEASAVHLSAPSHVRHGQVNDSAEAWFTTTPKGVCVPLFGCLPVALPLPSLYSPGTLHVGVTAGAESARSYVVPALGDLRRRDLLGGSLVLPVDPDSLDGTFHAGSAQIRACLTTGTVPDEPTRRGATPGAEPAVDCKVSAPASYDSKGSRYIVDLKRFIARWKNGTPNRGVALVPVLGALGPAENWQVAFDGRGAKGATIHSLITYLVRPAATRNGTPTSGPGAERPTQQAVPPAVGVPLPGETEVSPGSSPPAIAPPAQTAVYLIRSNAFRYPMIFVAPLAILAGAIFFGRLFTGSSIRPRTRTTMGADSSDG